MVLNQSSQHKKERCCSKKGIVLSSELKNCLATHYSSLRIQAQSAVVVVLHHVLPLHRHSEKLTGPGLERGLTSNMQLTHLAQVETLADTVPGLGGT